MRKTILMLSVFLMIGFVGCGKQNQVQEATEPTAQVKQEQPLSVKYTKDMYDKVQNGMSYEQIKAILGDGEEAATTEAGGIKTKIYIWKNFDGSNLNITLQNDKVLGKAQAGLK